MTLRPPALTVVAERGVATARLAEPDCPHCGGREGFVGTDEGGYEVWTPCVCKAAKGRAQLFNSAAIGSRFANATFDSFQPKSAPQAQALQQVQDFARMYPSVGRGLLLWGPVGTGKTHLMVALFRQLTLHKGVPCRFIDFGNLLNDIRRSFRTDRGDAAIVVPLVEVEVLLIDELGKGRATEWELTVLDDLISRRYNAGRITLCTTNFEPRDPAAAMPAVNPAYAQRSQGQAGRPPSLVERMDERIYSRLCEMCEFVAVPGADHRRRRQSRIGGRV